jgi:transaldolase
MKKVSELKIAIYADGADKGAMLEMYKNPFVKGFTTNPTLMAKSGITDYEAFAREVVKAIPDRPISFEVFSDDFNEMEAQALKINSWGKNVNVKIPITNTKKQYSYELIESLANKGVKINVTALFTLEQVRLSAQALKNSPWSIISVFSGRIADTGRDPVPMMVDSLKLIGNAPNINLLWASPRELLNIFQADEIGVKIITVTNDVIKKLDLVGKDMDEYSLETVKMFYNDAKKAGFSI